MWKSANQITYLSNIIILKWAAALANLFTLVAAAKAYPLPDGIISCHKILPGCTFIHETIFDDLYSGPGLGPKLSSDVLCHLIIFAPGHYCVSGPGAAWLMIFALFLRAIYDLV